MTLYSFSTFLDIHKIIFFFFIHRISANQGFYILGLYYASPTFSSAMQNSVPAITFIMASILGFEQVSITRMDGIAKILGTVASVGGATIITLYKGPPTLHQIAGSEGNEISLSSATKSQNWTLGCIFILGHCLSWAGWMVLQVKTLLYDRWEMELKVITRTLLFHLVSLSILASFLVYELLQPY